MKEVLVTMYQDLAGFNHTSKDKCFKADKTIYAINTGQLEYAQNAVDGRSKVECHQCDKDGIQWITHH